MRQSSLTFPEPALPARPFRGDPILRVRFSASSRLVLSWRSSNASAMNLFSCSSLLLVSCRSKTWPNDVDKLIILQWEIGPQNMREHFPHTVLAGRRRALADNLEVFHEQSREFVPLLAAMTKNAIYCSSGKTKARENVPQTGKGLLGPYCG